MDQFQFSLQECNFRRWLNKNGVLARDDELRQVFTFVLGKLDHPGSPEYEEARVYLDTRPDDGSKDLIEKVGTALHWALLMEDKPFVDFILCHYEQHHELREEYFNKKGIDDYLALHLAVKTGDLSSFRRMRPFIRPLMWELHGDTILDLAAQSPNPLILQEIVTHGTELLPKIFRKNAWDPKEYRNYCYRVMEKARGNDKIEPQLLEFLRTAIDPDEREMVTRHLFRDRQVYVDAANAVLVGAVLIASITFASWLQPPLGITSGGHVDVQHNAGLGAFWIFNSLSFYFAIGTVVLGARCALPRSHLSMNDAVANLRRDLLATASLFGFSVTFVVVAFAIAGCIVVTPRIEFQLYMIVPTFFGGFVCVSTLLFLSKGIVEDYKGTMIQTYEDGLLRGINLTHATSAIARRAQLGSPSYRGAQELSIISESPGALPSGEAPGASASGGQGPEIETI